MNIFKNCKKLDLYSINKSFKCAYILFDFFPDCDFNLDEYTDMNISTKGIVLSLPRFKSKVAALFDCEEHF